MSSAATDDLTFRRLALGPAAVMSLSEAAKLLPMSDGQARDWLRDNHLVRDLQGRSVVIWGDVLDQLRRVPVESAAQLGGTVKRRSFR